MPGIKDGPRNLKQMGAGRGSGSSGGGRSAKLPKGVNRMNPGSGSGKRTGAKQAGDEYWNTPVVARPMPKYKAPTKGQVRKAQKASEAKARGDQYWEGTPKLRVTQRPAVRRAGNAAKRGAAAGVAATGAGAVMGAPRKAKKYTKGPGRK